MDIGTATLTGLDATGMLRLLANGAITAVELLDAHLDLLRGRGGDLAAVVDSDPEAARAAARAADRRRREGRPTGPLAGLPMTVKDSFDVAGLRTSHGRLSDAHLALEDAPAVARARAAGAVLYGKTNVPELLADYQSANADFGRTLNPWDAERTPGGSSGGSAVAVASGLAAIELGSDLSGSIRMPAAWTGVFGHRPSNGVVSKLGHLPWAVEGLIEPPLSVAGPLARSARDLALALRVLAGPARLEAVAWRLELPEPRVTRLAGTRVGLWLADEAAPVEEELRSGILRLAAALEEAGCIVEELASPPGSGREALELFDRMQLAEIAHSLPEAAWASALAAAAEAGAVWAQGVTQPVRTTWRDWETQRAITAAWRGLFDGVDIVLAPAAQGAAPRHDERPIHERRLQVGGASHPASDVVSAWSRMAGLAMLPATVIPLGPGAESGLPLGAQLLGPYLEDRTPLRFAELLEAEGIIGFAAPPGW